MKTLSISQKDAIVKKLVQDAKLLRRGLKASLSSSTKITELALKDWQLFTQLSKVTKDYLLRIELHEIAEAHAEFIVDEQTSIKTNADLGYELSELETKEPGESMSYYTSKLTAFVNNIAD